MKIKTMILGSIVVALSACASAPKEQPVAVQQPERQVPPPVVSEPVPIAPVDEAPMEALTDEAIPQGPQPGSADHFKYASGDDRVYFGYNEYALSPQTRDILRSQAQWLLRYDSAIIVVGGNADERGTREYNLALGARRADAVKAFLVSQGVTPGRITTVSYGKERPIDGGSNETAWALNRNAHSAVLVGGIS